MQMAPFQKSKIQPREWHDNQRAESPTGRFGSDLLIKPFAGGKAPPGLPAARRRFGTPVISMGSVAYRPTIGRWRNKSLCAMR